jgi:heme-degrading monooxygenase HmoA
MGAAHSAARQGSPDAAGAATIVSTTAEEAGMEEHFVWMTTRRIKPGALADFERAWRPDPYPHGLRRAYAYWSEDGQEVIGVSFWDSKESCNTWRASQAEARRREAMAGYVLDEREAFYQGRELAIPAR